MTLAVAFSLPSPFLLEALGSERSQSDIRTSSAVLRLPPELHLPWWELPPARNGQLFRLSDFVAMNVYCFMTRDSGIFFPFPPSACKSLPGELPGKFPKTQFDRVRAFTFYYLFHTELELQICSTSQRAL